MFDFLGRPKSHRHKYSGYKIKSSDIKVNLQQENLASKFFCFNFCNKLTQIGPCGKKGKKKKESELVYLMLSIHRHLKQTVLNQISVLLSIYVSMYIPHLKEMSLSLLFFSMRIYLSYCIKTACTFNYSAL